jgi:hypothetical protein
MNLFKIGDQVRTTKLLHGSGKNPAIYSNSRGTVTSSSNASYTVTFKEEGYPTMVFVDYTQRAQEDNVCVRVYPPATMLALVEPPTPNLAGTKLVIERDNGDGTFLVRKS